MDAAALHNYDKLLKHGQAISSGLNNNANLASRRAWTFESGLPWQVQVFALASAKCHFAIHKLKRW